MEDLAATWRTTTAKRPLAVAGVSGSGDSGRFAAAVTVEALAMSADAGGERRVKTQSGLGRTDNDGSFPLLRALSCCLTPQGCLSGENPVLAPLSPDGRTAAAFPSLLFLKTSFWHPLGGDLVWDPLLV
uniref:Uncharacterized protein n=1 Tax=Oryza rufipogon TaxID=4529 RepID=A0A0E0NRN6_ORYRU